jgi:two-component system OmpR family response regulator
VGQIFQILKQVLSSRQNSGPVNTQPRILILEDEERLGAEINQALLRAGFETLLLSNGDDALEQGPKWKPDLLVADVMVPGKSGFEVARSLTKLHGIPTIFLTALGDFEHKAKGFSLGADDYIEKPFLINELMLRIRAVLNRTGFQFRPFEFGDISLNGESGVVEGPAGESSLTRTEAEMLTELIGAKGRVVSKAFLLSQVWGYEHFDKNIVEVHMSSLRKKLASVSSSTRIETSRGFGYSVVSDV